MQQSKLQAEQASIGARPSYTLSLREAHAEDTGDTPMTRLPLAANVSAR